MKKSHPAFTVIEILVSVVILSVSIILVLKIHSQNHEQIVYIMKRNKHALEDSLFLSQEVLGQHKEEKSAYDLLSLANIRIEKDQSRTALKQIKRKIYIPKPINLNKSETDEETKTGEGDPHGEIEEVKIKGDFSSAYFHFRLNGF